MESCSDQSDFNIESCSVSVHHEVKVLKISTSVNQLHTKEEEKLASKETRSLVLGWEHPKVYVLHCLSEISLRSSDMLSPEVAGYYYAL